MRLSVFLNLRFYEYNGQYKADEQYFKFWIRLAEKFSHMTLCVPTQVNSKKGLHMVDFDSQRISICPLPMYRSSLELYLKFPYLALLATKKCYSAIREADILIAVIPNILGLWLSTFARMNGLPPVFYVRGNLVNTVKYEYQNSRIAFLTIMVAKFVDKLARYQMRKHLCFVVGGELHHRYLSYGIKTIPIITSIIQENELIQFVPKQKLGDKVTLLVVGRLSAERGIETLLKALYLLKNTSNRFICKIVGDGPQRRYLEQKARNLSLDNVVFTGYIPYGPEMIRQYREADLFVLPSHTEGFPKVILEAMANAVPIVSTTVGGIPYVLKSGHDAILVPPQDPNALAKGINQLASDIDLYNKIGLNASQSIQGLTFERQSEVFVQNLNHYSELLRRE